MAGIKKAEKEVLKRIYAESVSNPEQAYGWVTETEGGALVTAGLLALLVPIVSNPTNSAQFGAVVTAEGAAAAGIVTGGGTPVVEEAVVDEVVPAAAVPAAPKVEYEVFENLTIPSSSRGGSGNRGSALPFEKIPVGGGFFIPHDGTKAFPKTKASQVSQANKRSAPKHFVSRKLSSERAAAVFGAANTNGQAGVGVFRTADVVAPPFPPAE
jgi:hypothetical protein